MSDNINVLLVGAGEMAIEYAKVLKALKYPFQVVGRGEKNAQIFEESTGIIPLCGGIENNLDRIAETPTHAIVAVGVPELAETTTKLIESGIRKILVEKPGGLYKNDIEKIHNLAETKGTNVYIAYNRRFYSSTKRAMKIIEEDGGVSSFHFEFTEWAHVIENLESPKVLKEQWLYANSSHVIDLAFFIGGCPDKMESFVKGELSWHHKGAVFAGAGVTDKGALFTYHANWGAPGRWSVEFLTDKHRLIFRPMEELQIQDIGTVKTYVEKLDDSLDKKYKPGLYCEVYALINNNVDQRLMNVGEQLQHWKWYEDIESGIGYNK